MRELDICFEIAKEIKKKEERILEIEYRTMSPKNQVITDMPRGGGAHASAMDDYLIKVERIEKAKDKLQQQLDNEWNNVIHIFDKCGVRRKEAVELMKLRFYKGLPWKKCAVKMKETYPEKNWNINKCFRTYRSILHKINI